MHQLYEEAKEFGQKYLAPTTKDVDAAGRYPEEAMKALAQHGYFGLVIPKEYGGQGKDIAEHAEVCTGLAESGASAALIYMMSNVGAYCLSLYGSDELKQRVLPDVAAGNGCLALAYSETGTGTHFYVPEVTEERHDGYSILNGTKSFVTGARHAKYYLTSTINKKDNSVNLWIIPADADGLTFGHRWSDKGVGLRGNASDPMILKNVKVDESYRITGNGDGDRLIFIAGLASSSAGIAMAIANAASKYAQDRQYSSGVALKDIETVQDHVATLFSRAYAARETLFNASQSVANKDKNGFRNLIAARITTTQAAVQNGTLGMRLVGGIGYVQGANPMERLMRDSLGAQVMAPGMDVLHVWLGRMLCGLPYLGEKH